MSDDPQNYKVVYTMPPSQNTQFREDVRAALSAVIANEGLGQLYPAACYVTLAIRCAEEIEKQLKEKGRL